MKTILSQVCGFLCLVWSAYGLTVSGPRVAGIEAHPLHDAAADAPAVVALPVAPPSEVVEVPVIELPAAPETNDCTQYVYPIRARGWEYQGGQRQPVYANGCCVALGGDQFASVAHLTEGMSPGIVVEVQIDGEWRAASFTPVASSHPGDDLSRVTVAGVDVPGVETRAAEYGEATEVFGLASNTIQHGTVSSVSAASVALQTEQMGIQQGDSGGAVFGCDGALLGIVRGHETGERRCCLFTPIGRLAPQAAAKQEPVTVQPSYQSCPNGQCYQPQFRVRKRR